MDLVEMRVFHTSASLSFQMNQIAYVSYIRFIFSSNETNQNICCIASPNEQKKTRENKKNKTLDTIWLPPWPHGSHLDLLLHRKTLCQSGSRRKLFSTYGPFYEALFHFLQGRCKKADVNFLISRALP